MQLGLLEPLHHLDLVVLERGDAALEGDHLLLHPLDVLGVADQSLVDPLLVALAPGLDLLDVGVDLGLLGGQVVDDDPRVLGLAVEPGTGLGELGEPRVLGERPSLVAQLVGARVQVLEVEQSSPGRTGRPSHVSSGFRVGRGQSRAGLPHVGAERAHPDLHRIAQGLTEPRRQPGSQVHSAAQCDTSSRAGPPCSRNSPATWWRRSLVT